MRRFQSNRKLCNNSDYKDQSASSALEYWQTDSFFKSQLSLQFLNTALRLYWSLFANCQVSHFYFSNHSLWWHHNFVIQSVFFSVGTLVSFLIGRASLINFDALSYSTAQMISVNHWYGPGNIYLARLKFNRYTKLSGIFAVVLFT